MKKKLLLMPLLMLTMTACVMYNGKGKPGKSSAAPQENSSVPAENSNPAPESTPAESVPASEPAGESTPAPASSVTPAPSSQNSGELPKHTPVTLYLVFGPYGLYKGNAVNDNIPELFLEHAMKYETETGAALPATADVTSSVQGSHFVAWTAYNNDGKLTEYLLAPGIQNKILYASFTGGNGGGNSGGGSTPVTPVTPGEYLPSSTGTLPASGYGFKFSDGTFMEAVRAQDSDEGHQQFKIENRKFVKDQIFQLYDFGNQAGWTVDLDPWSFGGDSDTSTKWKTYLARDTSDPANQKYKVLQDFNVESVYIKLKYGEDEVYFQLGA